MKVTLVHNPGAGVEGQNDAEQLVSLIRAAGHEVRYQSTTQKRWDAVLDEPVDIVAVCGGDGTIVRVAERLVDRNIPVAVLPGGTANNVARSLGIVGESWDRLVSSWSEARRMKLDAAIAKGPWGERCVFEGIGAGLFAWTIPEADASETMESLDRRDAKVAYALQMLKERLDRSPAIPIRATLDEQDISGDYVLFEAMNLPFVGPNLFLAPESEPGDGCLDVVLVTHAERDRLQHYLACWQEEKPRLAVLPSHRGRHLRLEWTGFDLHIDDEVWPGEGESPERGMIDLRIDDRSVEFLVPAKTLDESHGTGR
jgi:diacylglycerol kinase family enzyme